MRGIVAFSDPVTRTTSTGDVIKPGHWGQVYWACSFRWDGSSAPRRLTLLPDGTVFSDRAAQKVRSGDRGHDYAERTLVALGAARRQPGEDPRLWLPHALDSIGARTVRHPGNLRYTVTLGRRRTRRELADAHRHRPPITDTLWCVAS